MTSSSPGQGASHLIADDFKKLLVPLDLDILDQHDATIYGIRRDLTLGYANHHWLQFAADNEGSDALCQADKILNRSVLDSMAGSMRDFYAQLFERVLSDATPRTHEYDCSSPHVLRAFHMNLLPLPIKAPDVQGLLIVNSRSVGPWKQPRENPVHRPCDEHYLADDQVVMCSNCQRTRRVDNPDQWDWVPSYRQSPPAATSHGLCAICLDYYYPPNPKLDAES